MDKIKITIIEDEFVIAEDIADLLSGNNYHVLDRFDRAEIALDKILNDSPDLLLVDIQLGGAMNGIDLVKEIKKEVNLPVIYITANSEMSTYQLAKSTKPNAFLIKPFTPANLLAAIDLALFNFATERTPEKIEKSISQNNDFETYINKCLFIRVNGRHQKVCPENILFVEASGSYVHIQTEKERYTLSQNLSSFFKKMPTDSLVRVHRSYLVNITKIDSFKDSWLLLQNHRIPIGENYKSDFLSRIHLI